MQIPEKLTLIHKFLGFEIFDILLVYINIMSETSTINSKSGATKRNRDKVNSLDKFLNMCKEEYRHQYPTQELNEEEFKKKCTNRWKNMTKKEKEHFDKL